MSYADAIAAFAPTPQSPALRAGTAGAFVAPDIAKRVRLATHPIDIGAEQISQ
jgi:hypothetical protein